MAANKQKVVRSGRKPKQPPKSRAAPASRKPKLKLTFKRSESGPPDGRDAPAYQFPISAPPSDDAPTRNDGYDYVAPVEDIPGMRRSVRQRKPPQRDDVVYGSEMDNLITSSATIPKANDEEVGIASSPPAMISLRTPDYDSPPTVQGQDSPPQAFTLPLPQDVYDILNTLRSSPEIQVDLPNMTSGGVVKPYTAVTLTALYIQCYDNELWHLCDLVADTWIRALQEANRRSHKSSAKQCHIWRKNAALEEKFAEGKLGFKKNAVHLALDVEDPELAPDVVAFIPDTLRDLYARTPRRCGARLLWADAMALAGKKVEAAIVARPDVWPDELFFDVMCTALRLVGRKLTLKIEERSEGAWCRYHEHGKRGLLCYRVLAHRQIGGEGLKMRRSDGVREDKRVRFDAGGVDADAGGVDIDAGGVDVDAGGVDVDAEGDSEEE